MMKTRLNNLRKKVNSSMFDVAAAPMILVMFGMPLVLVIVTGALIGLAFSKISQIRREKKQDKEE